MAMSRTALTEQQWRQVEAHLPPNARHGHAYGGHWHVINGILWRFGTARDVTHVKAQRSSAGARKTLLRQKRGT
jgi:transposase